MIALGSWAQQKPLKLNFTENGEFKIAQFTDMHVGKDLEKNQVVADMIKQVLDDESPDLVVFTGDITTLDEVEIAWNHISALLAEREIPWTFTAGNHDDEYALNREEIMNTILSQPYCAMKNVAQDIKGSGNHVLPILSHAGNNTEALIYCFDSNSYSKLKNVKGYGWLDLTQIEWYKKESCSFRAQNNNQPLPALAFFHIPLPEYTEAWESLDSKRYGERNEKECAPAINSGMFVKMLECGDVMGTFVGHDHVNDYIATLYDIALAYGRASGGKNSYGDKIPGSRIIVLKEGKREFDTWIKEKDNKNKIDFCSYPNSFKKTK